MKCKAPKYLPNAEVLIAELPYKLIPAVDHEEKLIRDAKDQPILNAARRIVCFQLLILTDHINRPFSCGGTLFRFSVLKHIKSLHPAFLYKPIISNHGSPPNRTTARASSPVTDSTRQRQSSPGDPPPHQSSGLLPGWQFCFDAGLCQAPPCSWHPVGQQEVHEYEALRGLYCWLILFCQSLHSFLRIFLDITYSLCTA